MYARETSYWLKCRKSPKAKRFLVLASPCCKPGPLPRTVKLLPAVVAVLSFAFFVLAKCQMSLQESVWGLKLLLHSCSILYPEELCRLKAPTSLFFKTKYPQLPEMWLRNKLVYGKINLWTLAIWRYFFSNSEKISENQIHENQTQHLGFGIFPQHQVQI